MFAREQKNQPEKLTETELLTLATHLATFSPAMKEADFPLINAIAKAFLIVGGNPATPVPFMELTPAPDSMEDFDSRLVDRVNRRMKKFNSSAQTTLFHAACHYFNKPLVSTLLANLSADEMKALINSKDQSDKTPYQRIIESGSGRSRQSRAHIENVLLLLLTHGLDIQASQIVFYAVAKGMQKLVLELFENHKDAITKSVQDDKFVKENILKEALGYGPYSFYLIGREHIEAEHLVYLFDLGAPFLFDKFDEYQWPKSMAEALLSHAIDKKYNGSDLTDLKAEKISDSFYTLYIYYKRKIADLIISYSTQLPPSEGIRLLERHCLPPQAAIGQADEKSPSRPFFCQLFGTARVWSLRDFSPPLYPTNRNHAEGYSATANLFQRIQKAATSLRNKQGTNTDSAELHLQDKKLEDDLEEIYAKVRKPRRQP